MVKEVRPRDLGCIAILVAMTGGLRAAEVPDLAQQILEATGVDGGLIVHVGCGDGKLTTALRADDRYLVHGLDTDAAVVEKARAYIRSAGLYGNVSIDRFDGTRLPYADNLVNLIVADGPMQVSPQEMLRVLAPEGTAYVRNNQTWTKTVKPRPADTDEWTHYLHDAGGNAVAHDARVGPPRYLQWTAGPRHTRSHEHIPGIYALVCCGGRIFYIVDEAPIDSIRQPPQWRLVARDAYNGVVLWKRPIESWFPHIVNWGQTPRQLQRKLIADGQRVYVTLGIHAQLSALDAATGKTLRVYDDTRGTEEIICHGGTLLASVRSVTDERIEERARWAQLARKDDSPLFTRDSAEPLVKRLRSIESNGERAVVAIDPDSGRVLWKKSGEDVAGLRIITLCADDGRVFYQRSGNVVCLDLKTGRQQWATAAGPLRLVYEGNMVCADDRAVTILSADSGEVRWTQPASLVSIRDAFIAGGSLWIGGFKPAEGKRSPAWGPYFATQRDLATGKILMRVEPKNPSHHHRCYDNKATDRYILGGRRGTEFIDLSTADVLWNSFARGVCRYGVMPAAGLLYTPSHACACYPTAKLTGFNALAAERGEEDRGRGSGVGDDHTTCLTPGPAYDQIPNPKSQILNRSSWPTYRHDAERSGCTPSPVPAMLRRRWQVDLGGKLTSPTVAGGRVFVASPDDHRVAAVDADSGRPAWNFTTGGRVDSPPTWHQGRAIFGCRDGYVYSLRATDGALAWRLQAAREDRRIVACGQLESVSPVHGSVLIRNGVVYLTAGRSSYLDGGIDLCRIAPESGKILSRTPIYSPDSETGRQPPQSAPAVMPGARSDVLSADGSHVYLRDMVFDHGGNKQPQGDPHLFTVTDFLDDTWPHRSYWIFGKQCSIATGCSRRDGKLISGRLLVFNESTIYGYARAKIHWSNRLEDGAYRLFALNRGEEKMAWAKAVPPAARDAVPLQVRAMVLAGETLFLAGTSDATPTLMAVSTADGTRLAQYPLDSPPVFDGMAAADGRLYISLENGQLLCMDKKETN
ncbi:MAG: PQQ-binding-like beta-propeller repeat protein [Candidatus Nealsonbacteria bacterium]|nr:PQQ-binding-like beta-propeller repeat protein [Candidatus Nealsonbacteria bacterium]